MRTFYEIRIKNLLNECVPSLTDKAYNLIIELNKLYGFDICSAFSDDRIYFTNNSSIKIFIPCVNDSIECELFEDKINYLEDFDDGIFHLETTYDEFLLMLKLINS